MAKTLVNNPSGGFSEVEHDDNSVPMFAPDGKVYTVPKSNLNVALQNNWTLAQSGAPKPEVVSSQEPETPEDEEAQAKAEETEADIQAGVKYNEDHRVIQGLKRFGNEALFGVPEMIADYNATPEERAKNQEIRKRTADAHPVENFLEKGAGMAASLLIPGVGEAGDAVKGLVLGERAVAGGAERLAGEALSEAARPAVDRIASTVGVDTAADTGTHLTESEIAQGATDAANKAYEEHMSNAVPDITEKIGDMHKKTVGAMQANAAERAEWPESKMKDAADAFFDRTYGPKTEAEASFAKPFVAEGTEKIGSGLTWEPGTEQYWKTEFEKNLEGISNEHFAKSQAFMQDAVPHIIGNIARNTLTGVKWGTIATLPFSVTEAMEGDFKGAFESAATGALIGGVGGALYTGIMGAVGLKMANTRFATELAEKLSSVGMHVEGFAKAGARQAAGQAARAAWKATYNTAIKFGMNIERATVNASTISGRYASSIYSNVISGLGKTLWDKATNFVKPMAEKFVDEATKEGVSTREAQNAINMMFEAIENHGKSLFNKAKVAAKEKAQAASDAFRSMHGRAGEALDTTKTAAESIAHIAKDSPSLMRQVAAHAAKYGAEGAVYSALPASVQAAYGDPEQAAETMLWGAGLSGLLGGAVGGAGGLLAKTGKGILAPVVAGSAMHAAAAGLAGGSMFGLPGMFAGAAAGMFAEKAIHNFMNSKTLGAVTTYVKKAAEDSSLRPYLGAFIAKSGNEALDKHLSSIGGMITGSKVATRTIAAINPFAHITGKSGVGVSTEGQYSQIVQSIQNAAADSSTTAEKIGQVSSMFTGTSVNLSQAVAAKHMQAIGWLNSQIPKNPSSPKAFQKDDWKPTMQQKKDFLDKVAVVNNPMVVWQHYQEGTLSKIDRETLQATYPKIYQGMVNKIMQEAYDPRGKALSYDQRMQLSTFTGVPLDDSLKNLINIQKAVAAPMAGGAPQQGQGKQQRQRAPKFEHSQSLMTDSQRRTSNVRG